MTVKRTSAGFSSYNTYDWIVTGGLDDTDTMLASTEIRNHDGTWTTGPPLPWPLAHHCQIETLREEVIITGECTPF